MAVVRLRPADLREALRNDGTSLQFQVQVHVPTGTLAGVEALVRWPHFQYGMIGPQEIAQLVTQGGLHEEFDFWVIRAASKHAAEWVSEGVPLPLVSVNVWEQTLRSPELPGVVEGTRLLELELPRGAAADPAHVAMIGSLRRRGVRIAVESLPDTEVDTLKLRPPLDAGVVAAATARGVRVVAEGVESADQQAQALGAGCEIVQGFVFGPEVSAAEVSTLAKR
ncbi:MAG: EAL domain-containing protein [Chloroflexi bacterium]|nr:EAL domain-containing protein [Chloroflexota bacterium]